MSLYNKIIDLQKLAAAWQRVRRNKPAAGVDGVTWQQFDENSREELKQLQIELKEHRYEPLPVRNVTLYKGEKARVIALYSMRDKVVQQSLASELSRLFEGRLSSQSYAYRSEKSALQAIGDITAEIGTKRYEAALKADITHFFDNISWNLLKARLMRAVKEDDVLELIRMNACTAMLDDVSGELTEKTLGIHQGSAIAPVLSNIFMMDFDIALARPEHFYVRYSDDMLILGADKPKLMELMKEIKIRLEELRLSANEAKTVCCGLEEGVDFLGYHLDASGKSVPAKAEDRLYDRLETMWLTNPTLNVEEKAAKALEIIGGWQQYYRDERKMHSIYEYIAFAYAVGGRKEMLPRLQEERPSLYNACRDIAGYLGRLWKKTGCEALELLEYEQYFDLPEAGFSRESMGNGNPDVIHRLLLLYRKHFVFEDAETSVELMQLYTDAEEYENAQLWMDQTEKLKARKERFDTSRFARHRSLAAASLAGVVSNPAAALNPELKETSGSVSPGGATENLTKGTKKSSTEKSSESSTAGSAEVRAESLMAASPAAGERNVSVPASAFEKGAGSIQVSASEKGDSSIPDSAFGKGDSSIRTSASGRTDESGNIVMEVTERTPVLMLDAFAGRDDIFSIESVAGGMRRKSELQERPLTEDQIAGHLKGDCTVGTYVQRPNSTVRFIVWDIDVSKQFLLKYGNTGPEFDACLQHAYHKALEIQKLLEDKGMRGYIEFSGFRGYHVWLFLSEWIPVRFANMLTDRMEEEIVLEDDVTVECFPNKVRLKAGRFGQILKIPYGIHVRTGRRSCFIGDDGEPVTDIDTFADTLASYSLAAIRKILSYSMPTSALRTAASPGMLSAAAAFDSVNTDQTSGKSLDGKGKKGGNSKEDKRTFPDDVARGPGFFTANENVNSDILQELREAFGDLDASIWEILSHCSLMQYLCLKSKRTGYLTHFERLSVLHVFGHVGEEGKDFVHDVMRFTMNYQYNVTQRFIDRIPEKPVSCVKLREQYRKISAEVGCSCNFKRTKNCYPSPVLHALSLSKDMQDAITIPTSRTLSADKEKKVIEEINVHKKAQELAVRILELRKQQRSIEKSVRKVERELEKVYDSVEADALEIEMGLLVRRKKQDGYEWVIEI